MMTLNRELYLFKSWSSDLVYNNDSEANDSTYQQTQKFLFDKLTSIHLDLQPINKEYTDESKADVVFINEQLLELLDHLLTTYEKSKHVKILSVNLNSLFAKVVTFNLSIMMKNGHEKFNISLIEIVNRLTDVLGANVKKLSMSKNWYSSLKHLSVIVLQYIFTKFNGFLNNVKSQLVTACYKHLSKANDSYNSSIENGYFKSNYFSDLVMLIDIILVHDNSNTILDDKLFARLFKLFKFVTQKNSASASSSVFTYPLVSVLHSFSILVSLLKSDKYMMILNSTSRKSVVLSLKYLNSIKEYTSLMFQLMDTDHKKLKLALSKQLSDLLVFTFIVYGTNISDSEMALKSCINLLLVEYKKYTTSSNLKSAIIETLIQFISKLNLYYQTNRVRVSRKSNNINFVSLNFFKILDIIYSNIFEFSGSKSPKNQSKPDQNENSIVINNSISMNYAIKTLNHLELIHMFLLNEIDNDVNKLIVLSKLIFGDEEISTTSDKISIKCLNDVVGNNDLNIWYATNLLKFSQLLIEDLGEFILSDHGHLSLSNTNLDIASELVNKISTLCVHKNFRLRVAAVETLVKLLRIKPELCFNIMNDSLAMLSHSFENNSANNENSFNDNYSNSYLISSILSFASKEYITADFILSIFSLALDFLKKFNTSVVSTNLFGSNTGIYISNSDYEKQLVSWILLLGLFNYSSSDETIKSNSLFLQDSSQFLAIWKNLLAHTLPNGFLQIDNKTKSIKNINEIMKIIEIKNQSLVCLITYISFLTSNGDSLTEDLIRQLNQILIKSYTFIITLSGELSSLSIPQFLENSLNGNKLRIYEAYLKILPHLNIKNEINSTMLIEIVKNFCDIEKFRYQFKDPYGKFIKNSKRKIQVNKISEYSLYYIDDGVWYGLTSKFNKFKVDELMIKDKIHKVINNKSESDIDSVSFNSQFLIESPNIQSNLSDISIFDDTTESRNWIFLNHSLLHDSFMLLYNNSYDVGYTDTMKYPVPTDTMTIDTSIELFAISFPHLSSKIQLSVLESIRSFLFYKSKENISIDVNSNGNFDEMDETKIKLEFSLMLRKKAIAVNSSIALHSVLNYILRYNSNTNQKLRLQKDVAHLLIETLKNISFEDIYLVNLNTESIGICCSLVEGMDVQEEVLYNQVSIIINSIAETNDPNIRAFNIKALSQLTKFSNMINTTKITNTIFTLLLDPHPVVHTATLQSLDTFMNGKSNLEISGDLSHRILNQLESIWLSDNFGIRSSTTVASNINFREHSNSTNMMVKLVRSLINIAGPMIRLWDDGLKKQLTNFLFNFQYLVNFDYEIVVRELLKIHEELLVYDRSIINIANYQMLTKLMIINNFKIGVYGNALSNLPFDDEYDNQSTVECFPCTTSPKLLNMSLESAFQLFKLENDNIIDEDFEKLLWISLEMDPDNESIKNIVRILMQDSMDKSTNEKFEWFNKLIAYFNISKTVLISPLMDTFEKRINNGGMYFHYPMEKTKSTLKKTSSIRESSAKSENMTDMVDDLNEAEETLTSEQSQTSARYHKTEGTGKTDDDDDDDDDDDKYNARVDTNNSDVTNILDLSNEQINWKFKLFILEMVNTLLSYSETDDALKLSLSKRVPEFIRISFISSTSNLITLRISSLKLLGKIIELYSDVKDPLYPDVSILDQQQAQIMSAITPSFNRESSVDLAGEGIVLSSKFISSNIIDIKRAGRIIKILTTSLEDLASNVKVLTSTISTDKKIIKIGEIPILTNKSENKIKIYVLQAWSRMLILNENNKNSNEDLFVLINNYVKVLITMWTHSLREYAMIKYGSIKSINVNNYNEGVNLKDYENCWIDFVESICIVIDNKKYYAYLVDILGDDIGKLFMIIFGLCIEYLIKKFNKTNISYTSDDIRVIASLRKLFKLELSIQILFNEYIFSEFVDVINKLIIVVNNTSAMEVLNNVNELLKDIYLIYFEDLKIQKQIGEKNEKSVEDMSSDFDKLFELLRLITKIISSKLNFIKDKEILDTSTSIFLEASDFIIIKKCFASLIEMIGKLPVLIQIDLYSNLMYMLVLIHEFHNAELSTILLPVFQKTLVNYKVSVDEAAGDVVNIQNINNIFKILKLQRNSKEDQLLTFIILKTVPAISIDDVDIEFIDTMIMDGLVSKDANLLSLSVQTVKSIINSLSVEENINCERILHQLFPKLISALSDEDLELPEPRLLIEIFLLFIKGIQSNETTDDVIASTYELILPVLVFFHYKYGYESYVHNKLLELVELNSVIFKNVIQNCDIELKLEIQKLLNYDNTNKTLQVNDNSHTNESHIELKNFG